MTKIKAGDIITVEKAGQDYLETGDFENLIIRITDDVSQGFDDIRKLRGKDIYKIVKNDLHEDLAKAGVNVGHYSLLGEPIESIGFPKEGILVNGEHLIPESPGQSPRLKERFFFDEVLAQAIATELNKIELEKMRALKVAVDKAVNMLEQIVEKGMV